MITILGPTASGKTTLAANLAYHIGGEIISADSRQVYKGMTIGTGKDYLDYNVQGVTIPYHLIDIVEPGYEYNLYEFQSDFLKAYKLISGSGKIPILCGGTGLYIESVIKGYKLVNVPENNILRKKLHSKTEEELMSLLLSYKPKLHNTTDTVTFKRLIRAIEIEDHYRNNPDLFNSFPDLENTIFGISLDRITVRERITNRLKQRLEEGMIEEVENLLKSGIPVTRLLSYGLEYKYITEYLIESISYDEMFSLLNTAIHQFAKRQMTWFRRMERNGININWIDGNLSLQEKVDYIRCFSLKK
jgi:tRNA dimethylallyltransferase